MTYILKKQSSRITVTDGKTSWEISNSIEEIYRMQQEKEAKELAEIEWGNVHRMGLNGFYDGYLKASESFQLSEKECCGFAEFISGKGWRSISVFTTRYENVHTGAKKTLDELFALYKEKLLMDRLPSELKVEIEMEELHLMEEMGGHILKPKLSDTGKVTVTKII